LTRLNTLVKEVILMKLVLKQKQQLNLMMTTELKQAIALLQYSTEDIYDYLKEQELENPLIELVEKHDSINNSKNKKVESNERSEERRVGKECKYRRARSNHKNTRRKS